MPDSNLVWHGSGAFLMMMTTRVWVTPIQPGETDVNVLAPPISRRVARGAPE